jgi:glycosyltransferase involved in cell wall biosynthesis
MRLFFVNMHRLWGGQSAVVVLLAQELAKRGHELLVAGVEDSELVKRANAAGLPIDYTLKLERGFRPRSFFGDMWRLKRLWSSFRPHIILTNGAQDTWTCALARWLYRSPAKLIRWRHNSFAVRPHLFNRWLYGRLIDHVVVSSSEIAPLLVNTRLVKKDRITVFPPSTPLDKCLDAVPKTNLKKDLNVGEGTLTVCVGRLAPEKGHAVLFRAWRKVKAELPDAHLAIVGHGSQESALLALRAELDLDEHVHFLGFRDDVPRLYAASDLAVLSPIAGESFGIALLEAYATGLCCVATDIGGVRDLVIERLTGILVPPNDEDALAKALLRALRDPDLRSKLGAAGRARVLEKFTPDRLADRAEKLIKKICPDSHISWASRMAKKKSGKDG